MLAMASSQPFKRRKSHVSRVIAFLLDIRRLRVLGRDLDYAIVSRVHGGIFQLECSLDVGSFERVASARVIHGGLRKNNGRV